MRANRKTQTIISSLHPGEGLILANAFGVPYAQEILKALAPSLPITWMPVTEFDSRLSACQTTFIAK